MRSRRPIPAGAWWLWALGLAAAASQTIDVLLLAIIVGLAWLTVARHGDDASLRTLRFFVLLALVIVAMRLVFRIVIGGGGGTTILFRLPELPLPDWAGGIRFGGPVTAEELRAGFADGLRLATIVICVGSANALADPRRLMRSLPRALHAIGTAVVVAFGLAPQLVSSAGRVRRAMMARAGGQARSGVARLVNPVINDALDRTLALAGAMEARGFGRPLSTGGSRSFLVGAAGMLAVAIGLYVLLDATAPGPVGATLLAVGGLLTIWGLHLAGRRRPVTVYRRDEWHPIAWMVALSGLLGAVLFTLVGLGGGLSGSGSWANPSVPAVLAILIGGVPLLVVDPPVRRGWP